MMTNISSKKSLGAYYTPEWLADLMVGWAVRTPQDRILDPSFGGCAFLRAALNCELSRASRTFGRRVHGVDIDRAAFEHAKPLFESGLQERNVFFGDFLDAEIHRSIGLFDAVVGNPPYVRHHSMTHETVRKAQSLMENLGAVLPRQASAWAYFAIAASAILAPNGRLALVLPIALLHAQYGSHVLRHFEKVFTSVKIVRVRERLFEDTSEQVVIVLASRERGKRKRTEVISVNNAREIFAAIGSSATVGLPLDYKTLDIPDRILEAYERVKVQSGAVPLGRVADVIIGVVTGANNFFVRHPHDDIFNSKLVHSPPIVASSSWLANRPVFLTKHLRMLERSGTATRLAIIEGARAGCVLRELKRARKENIHLRHHCSMRDPWYTIVDREVPDAFLGYMGGQSAPSMAKNGANALSTNAVHRLFISDATAVNSIVSSAQTSLFAFESELYGRHYGGGILKLEPSAAKKLNVDSSLDILREISEIADPQTRRAFTDATFAKHWGVARSDMQLLLEGERVLRGARIKPSQRGSRQGAVHIERRGPT